MFIIRKRMTFLNRFIGIKTQEIESIILRA